MNPIAAIASIVSRALRPLSPSRIHFDASPITDNNFTAGVNWNAVYRDRYNYQRDTVLSQSLLSWRLNPLARRLVTITRQYVTDQIEFQCDHQPTADFLQVLWNHPLNRLGQHLGDWCDELTITGNLFLAITQDSAGMSYIRVFPTDAISTIETAPNDVQQEIAYHPKPTLDDPEPAPIPNYYASLARKPKTVMLHFAVNRLAGMSWGEPDLAPLLPWLSRYASWLEDRVRLNRFRQAYLYIVKGKFLSAAEKQSRQNDLNANPPTPGSILVTDENEDWGTLSPQLDSFEANNDGLTLKKFIASGHGVPLHWLSEPEGSTRTTAEAAGTPTFKTLEERQAQFLTLIQEVLTVAVSRRTAKGDLLTQPAAPIKITAGDVSERDNAALALATSQIVNSFGSLYNAALIDSEEFLRVVYRFAGEVLPEDRPDNPKPSVSTSGIQNPENNIDVDRETQDVRVKEPS